MKVAEIIKLTRPRKIYIGMPVVPVTFAISGTKSQIGIPATSRHTLSAE